MDFPRSSKSRSRKKADNYQKSDELYDIRMAGSSGAARRLLLRVCLAAVLTAATLLAAATLFYSPRQSQQRQQKEKQLPHCIIIGARKCGTRALLDFLDAHPGVAAARSEIHYFDKPSRLRHGVAWYRSQMPLSRPDQLTIEKTPAYFVTESAPRLARNQIGANLRLLLIVRDPVTRVVSDYAQHLHRRAKSGRPARPLERLVLSRAGRYKRVNPRARMIRTSMYHRHLRRWLRQFPANRLHIVDGDRLISEPHVELRLVEQFLGLTAYLDRPERFVFNATKGFYCVRSQQNDGQQQRCLGSEKGRQHPAVSPATLATLRAYFEPHDDRLAKLTGRRFSWMTRATPSSDEFQDDQQL